MEFNQLSQRALEIRRKYAELETRRYGRAWLPEELALGFMADLGDLSRLILAKEGIRSIADVDDKLAHELSDCLWSILVLSDKYGVDLEQAFLRTMSELEERIDSELK